MRNHLILAAACAISAFFCTAGTSSAAPLAQDSAYFAACWSRLQGRDSTLIVDTSAVANRHAINFYSAWLALQRGQHAAVPGFLAKGIPAELTDHARRLHALALEQLGREREADSLWWLVARDTCSSLAAEACLNLARRASARESLDDLRVLHGLCEQYGAEAPIRQEIARHLALAEARQGEHDVAVNRLREALLAAPATDEATRVREVLNRYARDYEHRPRSPSASELESELEGISGAESFALGRSRVRQVMQSPLGPANADLLGYFKGRFESGARHHRDAVSTLRDHRRRFPASKWRAPALYYLGRSAYLSGQDSLAISALEEVAADTAAGSWRTRSLDLLGILHRDRHRPAEAARAYERWDSLGIGEPEGLWRLGWSYWDCARFNDAAAAWHRLAVRDPKSDWVPPALYWFARACGESGRKAEADSARMDLHRRYPYSYYSVIAGTRLADSLLIQDPLSVPALDEISSQGGDHSRKFALLSALHLPDMALKEWPAAAKELPPSDGLVWRRAELHFLNGNRHKAWVLLLQELGRYLRSGGERPVNFNQIAYPLDHQAIIAAQAAQHSLDPSLVAALVCQESHFDPEARSAAGALGLMQLMPATAKREARKLGLTYSAAKLKNPEYNIRLGAAHLAGLLADFAFDTVLVLAAYNAGPSAAQAWYEEFGDGPRDVFVERIPYRETRLFIKRVLEHRAAYRRLHPELTGHGAAVPSQSSLR